ncbi:hypothetical protein WP12_12105 [Sphingomonas sp. SRS2]|nr:hypothetical protein WP12_12105 [Sphingomonas sp. SRS2]
MLRIEPASPSRPFGFNRYRKEHRMTTKERRAFHEGVAIVATGALGVFVIPTLINAHQSVALLAGACLGLAWLAWGASFLFRISKEK